jgi:hypothetical protein
MVSSLAAWDGFYKKNGGENRHTVILATMACLSSAGTAPTMIRQRKLLV